MSEFESHVKNITPINTDLLSGGFSLCHIYFDESSQNDASNTCRLIKFQYGEFKIRDACIFTCNTH